MRPRLISRGRSGNIDDAMDEAGLPLLGIVPEDEDLIACGNSGTSIIAAKKHGAARAYQNIARRLDGERVPADEDLIVTERQNLTLTQANHGDKEGDVWK